MLVQYAIVGIILVGAIGFASTALVLSRLLQIHRPYKRKTEIYECGMPTVGTAWVRFKISYFIVGLLFLIFDVSALFLYPWAVEFTNMGAHALVEMIVFLLFVSAALAYAMKEGALKWL
jgi:NADH:ubiquinone oxidoreductase subunit 3 (subunit A)